MSNRHNGSGSVVVSFSGDLSQLRQAKQDAKQIVRDTTRELQQEARAASSAISTAGSAVVQNAADLIAGQSQVAAGASGRLAQARTRGRNRRLRTMESTAARNMAGGEADELFGVDADERSFRRFLADDRRERGVRRRLAGRAVLGRSAPTLDSIAELMPQPEAQQGLSLRPGAINFAGVAAQLAGRFSGVSAIASRFGITPARFAAAAGPGLIGGALFGIARTQMNEEAALYNFNRSTPGLATDATHSALAASAASMAGWGRHGFGRLNPLTNERIRNGISDVARGRYDVMSEASALRSSLAMLGDDPVGAARSTGAQMVTDATIAYDRRRREASDLRAGGKGFFESDRAYRTRRAAAADYETAASDNLNATTDQVAKQNALADRTHRGTLVSLRASARVANSEEAAVRATRRGDPYGAFMEEQKAGYLALKASAQTELAQLSPGSEAYEAKAHELLAREHAFVAKGRFAARQFVGNAPQGLSFANALDAIGEGKANAMMGRYADRAETGVVEKWNEMIGELRQINSKLDKTVVDAARN